MNGVLPSKIAKGSHIRVIAPSRSLRLISDDTIQHAQQQLEARGFVVSIGTHAYEIDEFKSSSVKSRIADLHDAFADSSVDAIFTAIGGYNSNQLLDHIDYELIAAHPKIVCGYSDITALHSAIHARTNLVTYYGPHFSSWGMKQGFDYTAAFFEKALMHTDPFAVTPSAEWSDDEWYIDQDKRVYVPNEGYWVMHEGAAEGRVVGGHARSLSALQGTRYWPGFQDSILILEENAPTTPELFDRILQSFIHQPDFGGVKGIVIGRFQKATGMTRELLQRIVEEKKELSAIPIIANVDFGHTSPIATIPLGGTMAIRSNGPAEASITILTH